MLHPQQFEVNEAWIAFRLNGTPVRTERDGDFNCIALMDAASCFILGSQFIPASAPEPTRAQFRCLLQNAQRHKQQLPDTLFIAREDVADLSGCMSSSNSLPRANSPRVALARLPPMPLPVGRH